MITALVYTDGFCWPNPGGVIGRAAIVDGGESYRSARIAHPDNTNNTAELGAIILGLANVDADNILIRTDSKYCADGHASWLRTERRDRKNANLFAEIEQLCNGRNVAIEWVRAGRDPLNRLADYTARTYALPYLPPHIAAAIRIYDQRLAAGDLMPPLYEWLHARSAESAAPRRFARAK